MDELSETWRLPGVSALAAGQSVPAPAGSIARRTFDAGPMLTLVESSVGELCPDRAPESGIAHHPFWDYLLCTRK
jgi:hypothetical protein